MNMILILYIKFIYTCIFAIILYFFTKREKKMCYIFLKILNIKFYNIINVKILVSQAEVLVYLDHSVINSSEMIGFLFYFKWHFDL